MKLTKLLIKSAIALMIVTLSSIEWILGFVAVMMILIVKLIDLLLIAENRDMARIDRRIAEMEADENERYWRAKDSRFKRRMEENY